MRYALLSVYNKEGIVEFAQGLVHLGWGLIASGGTAKVLQAAGLPVRDVAEFVGGGPILGHRVVTLSREIHAALLANDTPEDNAELERIGVPRIELVCVDLYPVQLAIKGGKSRAEVRELTDIGGPAMLRAAAKGERIVICDPLDRPKILQWLKDGELARDLIIPELADKVEFTCARYSLAIAEYNSKGLYAGQIGRQVRELKYGENPYQRAALYTTDSGDPLAIPDFEQIDGQDPSYINITDLDRGLTTAVQVAAGLEVNRVPSRHIGLIVKHGNATGVAYGDTPLEVIKNMIDGNPGDAFGGVATFNFTLDLEAAKLLRRHRIEKGASARPLDGVAAPGFTEEAKARLQRESEQCRMFANPELAELKHDSLRQGRLFRQVRGGFLVQEAPQFVLDLKDERMQKLGYPATISFDPEDLLLAWAVGSTSNSNTIVLCEGQRTVAVAVGQQSRVGAANLALQRALDAKHAVLGDDNTIQLRPGVVAYSDSYFPFSDGPLVLTKAGVRAIFTSSGSIRDEEVGQAMKEAGVNFWTLPDKVCRGFFGH